MNITLRAKISNYALQEDRPSAILELYEVGEYAQLFLPYVQCLHMHLGKSDFLAASNQQPARPVISVPRMARRPFSAIDLCCLQPSPTIAESLQHCHCRIRYHRTNQDHAAWPMGIESLPEW